MRPPMAMRLGPRTHDREPGRTHIAVYMSIQLGLAAGDIPTIPPAELYERFLAWTRSAGVNL